MRSRVLTAAALGALASCTAGLFSSEPRIDRSQPVALIETQGGIELGAATEFGVLTLGRTATDGPCRVHYFLGSTPLIEDGTLLRASAVFTFADIELKTQRARCLDRDPTANDELLAMWLTDTKSVQTAAVTLAADPAVKGDALSADAELPAGAALFAQTDAGLRFFGLVAGKAELTQSGQTRAFYVFAGMDRVRELLATPQEYPPRTAPKFRYDGIVVDRPLKN